jgi:hypothetical protein
MTSRWNEPKATLTNGRRPADIVDLDLLQTEEFLAPQSSTGY